MTYTRWSEMPYSATKSTARAPSGRGKVVTSQAKESLPPGRETKGYEAVRRDAPSSMIEGTYSKSKINRHSGAGEK